MVTLDDLIVTKGPQVLDHTNLSWGTLGGHTSLFPYLPESRGDPSDTRRLRRGSVPWKTRREGGETPMAVVGERRVLSESHTLLLLSGAYVEVRFDGAETEYPVINVRGATGVEGR